VHSTDVVESSWRDLHRDLPATGSASSAKQAAAALFEMDPVRLTTDGAPVRPYRVPMKCMAEEAGGK